MWLIVSGKRVQNCTTTEGTRRTLHIYRILETTPSRKNNMEHLHFFFFFFWF